MATPWNPQMLRVPRPTLAALCLALLLPAAAWGEDPPATGEDVAAPAQTPVERAPLEERSQEDATALERQLPEKEQQQLKAGEDSFLALWKPANVAEPSGVVILLPGDGESADWPRAIAPLRSKLPDIGWHSLSLTLPDPRGNEPPPRPVEQAEPPAAGDAKTEKADPATPPPTPEQAGSAEPSTDLGRPVLSAEEERKAQATRIAARIQAAIVFVNQQSPKTIVLLGHGSGAYWAVQALSDSSSSGIDNLVLVEAEVPPGYGPPLEESAPKLKQAIGDFFYQDKPLDSAAALKRLQASKRDKHPAYVQVGLKSLPNRDADQEQLFRRVRGWLDAHLQAPGKRAPAAAPAPIIPQSPGI
ncbi:hypothetical protein PHLH8_06230 [Pseudomonas sp. Pc102]|nr:hypothetical protein PHLH8_06230 [Pseudomonas sp. Pc102]